MKKALLYCLMVLVWALTARIKIILVFVHFVQKDMSEALLEIVDLKIAKERTTT